MLAQSHTYHCENYGAAAGPYRPINELIEEMQNGRVVILHDETANQGFLLGAAQMASPTMINFMAHHGRGVICLALTPQRLDELALPLMADTGLQRGRHAFTVSIEARNGVTTGISAADRAKTIATAIYSPDPSVDIVTPGHVFPLQASDGGVLARAGHAEAAIDLPRLAGLNPSGVICGVINDHGDDAQLDDLLTLARQLDLKIGSIQDMVIFRQKQDRFVHCTARTSFESSHGGEWNIKVFTSEIDQSETVVLQKGEVGLESGVWLELQAFSLFAGMLGEAGAGDHGLSRTMSKLSGHDTAIIILTLDAASNSLAKSLRQNPVGNRLHEHNLGNTAQILTELDVQSIRLLSRCDLTAARLRSLGVTVTV